MKQLQCNFTTQEQSKRLLELGVPADSADCYYTAYGLISVIMQNVNDKSFLCEVGCTPCWSVGRLIEIFNECSNWNTVSMTSVTHETYIEQLIELYEKLIGSINFSKL